MAERRNNRTAMQIGDRILVNKGTSKHVLIVSRVELPHSTQRAFVTRSGAGYSIGLRVWKSDYVWNEKSRMWVPKQ